LQVPVDALHAALEDRIVAFNRVRVDFSRMRLALWEGEIGNAM
jgi:hypothetical protein